MEARMALQLSAASARGARTWSGASRSASSGSRASSGSSCGWCSASRGVHSGASRSPHAPRRPNGDGRSSCTRPVGRAGQVLRRHFPKPPRLAGREEAR